jgi:hypothetical protein
MFSFSSPFMPFICSVLKPFGDLSLPADRQALFMSKKSKSYLPYFYENVHKYQSDLVNLDTLLNSNLSILPFKAYFYQLYKLCEIFNRLDYLINEYDNLKQPSVQNQLISILNEAGCLANNGKDGHPLSPRPLDEASNRFSFKSDVEQTSGINLNSDQLTTASDEASRFGLPKSSSDLYDQQAAAAVTADDFALDSDSQIKLENIYEQKFYIALLYLPNLLFDMSDPRKNQLAQSICIGNDSFDLILPYVINLFENPNTCVNSFLCLFNKLSKFLSRNELTKRVLPILIQVLNVVDLSETIGIDLNKDEEKFKYCKLFDYVFINELRIIFGLKTFLTQICPFLIEAISGFKDFEYEIEAVSHHHHHKAADSASLGNETTSATAKSTTVKQRKATTGGDSQAKKVSQLSPVFDMDNGGGCLTVNEEKAITDEKRENFARTKSLHASCDALNENNERAAARNSSRTTFHFSSSVNATSSSTMMSKHEKSSQQAAAAESNSMVFECDRASLNSSTMNMSNKQVNVSSTAFSTFTKIIQNLGPVLTCKYCCSDLFKMLAVCYMNNKCLNTTENSGNFVLVFRQCGRIARIRLIEFAENLGKFLQIF